MNIAKNALLAAIAFAATAQAIDVTGVSARQRWPWNNLVDIDFTLSGTDAGAFYQVDVAARFPGIEGVAPDRLWLLPQERLSYSNNQPVKFRYP